LCINFAGPYAQPIFQPVTLNVFPPLPMLIVRSHIPGKLAAEMAKRARRLLHGLTHGWASTIQTHSHVLLTTEHHVFVHFVHDDQAVPLSAQTGNLLQLNFGVHFSQWVIRSVNNYSLCLLVEQRLQLCIVKRKITGTHVPISLRLDKTKEVSLSLKARF
jgi:hypothetical protein